MTKVKSQMKNGKRFLPDLARHGNISFPVVVSRGPHPFPSRTRKLSLLEPMVLRGQLRGRVGSRRDYLKSSRENSRELFHSPPNRKVAAVFDIAPLEPTPGAQSPEDCRFTRMKTVKTEAWPDVVL